MSGDALAKVKSLIKIADLFYNVSLAHEFCLGSASAVEDGLGLEESGT